MSEKVKPEVNAYSFPKCPDDCAHFNEGDGTQHPCGTCVRNCGVTSTLHDWYQIKED